MAERTVKHDIVVQERRLKATPARVFRAWSNPDERRKWDVPGNGWVLAEFRQDFRVGGVEMSRFGPPGEARYYSEGHYLSIAPDSRIISAGVMHDGNTPMTATMLTVEFYPDGSGTRLVLTDQSAYFGMEKASDRQEGWGEILTKLAAALGESA